MVSGARGTPTGAAADDPGGEGLDDVGFITAVAGDIGESVGIDTARVYATGISNGGMMAYALACNTSTFAAIGPDSATQLDPCTAPHPTSVMHIHGTADRLIRYDGEPGDGVARIDGLPLPDLNAFWRNVDRRSTPTVTSEGRRVSGGRSVTLITIEGGGHQWPGSAPVREGADPPSQALNATHTLWQFFAAHPG